MSLDLIIDVIRSERCLPFLGAGASASYARDGFEIPGIPLGGRLGEMIAQACQYHNGSTYDLPAVAEYYVYRKNGRRDDPFHRPEHRSGIRQLLSQPLADDHRQDPQMLGVLPICLRQAPQRSRLALQ